MYSVITSVTHREGGLDCLQLEEHSTALFWTDGLDLVAGHPQEQGAAEHPQATHRTAGDKTHECVLTHTATRGGVEKGTASRGCYRLCCTVMMGCTECL